MEPLWRLGIANHNHSLSPKLIPTPARRRYTRPRSLPQGRADLETVSTAGEGSGARGIRRGVDGLEVEAGNGWETDASPAVGVTTRHSGVLVHPPAVGIRPVAGLFGREAADEPGLGKRWSGAKISPREGGRNGHSIYYTA